MYKRWKIIKDELDIVKEDIKAIRCSINGENSLKEIFVEDKQHNKVHIIYCMYNKTYEILINYSNGLDLTTPVLKWNKDAVYYKINSNGVKELY